MKNTKRGITLIALVITVIILLILAGITLNMTLGENGILRHVKYATEEYENKAKEEENMLAQVDAHIKSHRETVTMPKEEFEKMQLIYKPNKWEVGTEYDFGDNVYGRRFTGTFDLSNSKAQIILASIGEISIINTGGWVKPYANYNNFIIPIDSYYNSKSHTTSAGITHDGIRMYLGVHVDVSSSTGNSYDIWVLYTKTTD